MDLKELIKRNWLTIILAVALTISLIKYFDIKSKYDLVAKKYKDTSNNLENVEEEKEGLESKVKELENDY